MRNHSKSKNCKINRLNVLAALSRKKISINVKWSRDIQRISSKSELIKSYESIDSGSKLEPELFQKWFLWCDPLYLLNSKSKVQSHWIEVDSLDGESSVGVALNWELTVLSRYLRRFYSKHIIWSISSLDSKNMVHKEERAFHFRAFGKTLHTLLDVFYRINYLDLTKQIASWMKYELNTHRGPPHVSALYLQHQVVILNCRR